MVGIGVDLCVLLVLFDVVGDGCCVWFYFGLSLGNFILEEVGVFFLCLCEVFVFGDSVLIGIDFIKEVECFEVVYDDLFGVMVVFNLNVLCNLNCFLGVNFDVWDWCYVVLYCLEVYCVEMYLEVCCDVIV